MESILKYYLNSLNFSAILDDNQQALIREINQEYKRLGVRISLLTTVFHLTH